MPYFMGFLGVAILASLGLWQITRGMEKRAGMDAFAVEDSVARYRGEADLRPFRKLRIDGYFDADRQLLLDNSIVDGRNGHFVITPVRLADSGRTVLVNRGWISRDAATDPLPALTDERVALVGRVGRMPRAGMRMGEPFEASTGWPRHAVYPTLDETAELLGTELEPFVLLLDPDEQFGFVRVWAPGELSASRHFGYAFQWFAMAATLAVLLVWHRTRRRENDG
jgi:surfeit locus 1 family protein